MLAIFAAFLRSSRALSLSIFPAIMVSFLSPYDTDSECVNWNTSPPSYSKRVLGSVLHPV